MNDSTVMLSDYFAIERTNCASASESLLQSPFCSGARMPTSANCPKNPSDVRADVGIRAPILPFSQQPLASCVELTTPLDSLGCRWTQEVQLKPRRGCGRWTRRHALGVG